MIRGMQARDRLIVAADLSSRDDILRLVDELQGAAGIIKIGLQAFIANGPSLVREVVERGEKVFLDLKIHDIPNTARNAVAEAATLGATMLTVHAGGGASMLHASVHPSLLILGVTVLTSFDSHELASIGMNGTPMEAAVRLARLASTAGLGGVVASPHEIRAIREACGDRLRIVTPGVRPAGSEVGDQKRTMTPREAVHAGADYIVVGRPITGASDRRAAAERIIGEMES